MSGDDGGDKALDNTFEIRDEEIDVEEIMRKIRENIRKRKEAGIYPEGEIEKMHPDPAHQNRVGETGPVILSPEARRDLDYVNSNWNIENNSYFICSHRQVTGRFLVTGRQLVHGEVRRYVDPAIWKQKEFNASAVRLLNEVARTVEQVSAKLADIDGAIQGMRSEISDVPDHCNSEIGRAKSEILRGIEAEIRETRSEIEAELSRLDSGIEERIDVKVGETRSGIGSELEKLGSEIEERVEGKVGEARAEIEDEIRRRIIRIDSTVDERIEAKVGQTRAEIEAGISQLDSGINERIDAKVGQTRAEIEAGISQLDSGINERIDAKVGQARAEIEAGISQLDSGINERIDAKVGQTRSEIEAGLSQLDSGVEERVRREANAVVSAMNQDIQNKSWLATILEGRLKDFEDVPLSSDLPENDGINYFVFEETFRGSREVIKERQAAFVQYFEGSKNVLDIGCGRGEFLELLCDKGIGGRGIDINEDMVEYCRSRGLDVERIDAVTYLEGIEDKSLDGIFIDQVVEHLRPDYLVKMLGLCYKKLKYGYYIVAETVNPLSFFSFANFYIDLTHVRPVHPATLRFLLGSVGYRGVEVRFFSPVPDEDRLNRVNPEEKTKELMGISSEIYNQNVDMINNVLYGAQDYAVIGKK